jgi:hypothetical protein
MELTHKLQVYCKTTCPGTADLISGKFKGFGAKIGLNWNYL